MRNLKSCDSSSVVPIVDRNRLSCVLGCMVVKCRIFVGGGGGGKIEERAKKTQKREKKTLN